MVEQAVTLAFPRVDLPGVGTVSLTTLGELRDARRTEQARVDQLSWQVAELTAQAEDWLAAAGAVLVPRRAWWPVPAELEAQVARAERLASRIALLDQRIGAPPPGPAGPDPGSGIRGWGAQRARRRRDRAAAQLRQSLVMVASAGADAGAGVPDVEPLLEQAGQVQAQAEGLRSVLAAATGRLAAVEQEIRLREEAERRLGFDSLHLAAYFRLHGLPVVQSPLALEPGETAHLSVPAMLVRTPSGFRPGGSGGLPVACTGINHWMGVLRSRRAPRQAGEQVDSGMLVVSSGRLVFLDGAQPLAIPLASVIDLDVYDDGIAVQSLGREELDLLLVGSPRHVAFYFNWALANELGR